MWLQAWKQFKTHNSLSLSIKCGAIFLLFLLSVLIVACGGSANDTSLGQPDVTVTINLGQDGSPTPPLPEYICSAWVTNTSPSVNTSVLGVYAKYVHNVEGNPQGIGQSQATADVHWYDGGISTVTTTTTSDGLAVFAVSTANRAADLNKIIPITVSFQGPSGVPSCDVSGNRAAFFTLVLPNSVTISGTPPMPGPPGTSGGSPPVSATAPATGSPTITLTPSPITDPTPYPTPKPTMCPSPKPGKKTPTPCP